MTKKNAVENLAEVAYIANKKTKNKPTIENPQDETADKYFRPLGHMSGYLYFMTSRGQHVLRLSAAQLSQKANLFLLAPLQWWEKQYQSDDGFKGVTVDMAVSWLISTCYGRGAFSPSKIRGVGAWWDEGRGIVHAGDHLLVDGVREEINGFVSEYVYEAQPAIPIDLSLAASDAESVKLVQLCTMLHWENPLYGVLCAGWVVSALACGALEWRPHAITTGPSGCGKSWVAKHVIYKVLGDFRIGAKGSETSEAGVRQALKHNSVPVVFDEAESEDQRTTDNVNKILGLMRTASAEGDGQILKGGADGTAAAYTIRSAFHLFSIRVPLQQTADINRVTVLTLNRNTEENKTHFREVIAPFSAELEASNWSETIRARVFSNIGTLRKNAAMFAAALTGLFNARIGDQYGALLGGAWLMGSTVPVTMEKAEAKVKEMNHLFDDVRDLETETDETKLLASMLAQQLRVPGDKRELSRSVAELVEIIHGDRKDEVWADQADGVLQRHGIRVKGGQVLVANKHEGLSQMLSRSAWSVGWSHILRRIVGAEGLRNPTRFAGNRSRCVSVPINMFLMK